MHVIAKSALIRFWTGLPKDKDSDTAKAALTEWHTTVSDADWNSFSEVRATFNTADYVNDGKGVFDVGGNKYRVVGLIGFKSKRVFILFVGTHSEYDRIDVARL